MVSSTSLAALSPGAWLLMCAGVRDHLVVNPGERWRWDLNPREG